MSKEQLCSTLCSYKLVAGKRNKFEIINYIKLKKFIGNNFPSSSINYSSHNFNSNCNHAIIIFYINF